MSLRVGFGLITAQVPPWAGHSVAEEYADTLAMTRLVEDLGYDSVWVSEHHLAEDSYLPSTLPLLAAMAAVTSRVELGTGIALAPMHHPLRFAEDCAVVDVISGGRLLVGLGAGWRHKEFEVFGVPVGQRGRRTQELAEISRRAWGPTRSGDDVSSITPKPVRPIPLLLGGTAVAPIERAGRLADGYIGTPHNDLQAFRSAVDTFDRAAADAGRDPATMSLALHVNAWVSADGEIPPMVLDAMWHLIGSYARWHAVDAGKADPGDDLPPVDLGRLRARTIYGTPVSVVAQVTPWIEEFAGREFHMIFRLHYPGMRLADAEPAIRMFADSVVPQLRAVVPRAAGARGRAAAGSS
jgi:alkanesulfonate monooxygenase SsuD/methylene tetrahydromethanopterin reductase-like flavin-dependent oxidoreductase (luciferase family)